LQPLKYVFLKNKLFYIISVFVLFYSCKKEEEIELPRDVAVQVVEDVQNIEAFL